MGEMEGSYRAIQTPGTRLGAQFNAGISTLEPGQSLSDALSPGGRSPGRGLQLRVQGLDDTQEFYDLESRADGQTLLSDVFRRSNLMESDYFGLEFQNMQMSWVWLEPTKLVVKQVKRPMNTLFRLSVKFFPPDPGQLQEEYTRYLFSLQMKRDLLEGRLSCTENTASLLASHLLQSEIGDYDDMADRDFLKLNKLLPNQERIQERIMELHYRHLGQTPADSDFQVLEIARKLEMYGVRFHPAADREGTKINLAVAHIGLQVFQGNTKINTFNWSKIRKLSFKRKRFLIKLYPEVHGPHQDTLEFQMVSRDQCKIFWKNCVEHHSFFRLLDQPQPKSKAILFSRGSSFRYSGRTQKQLVEYVKDSGARRTPYQRRNSKVRMSARSLAPDVPKQTFSFNDSLRAPGSPSSATGSFHSIQVFSSPTRPEPQAQSTQPPPQSQAQSTQSQAQSTQSQAQSTQSQAQSTQSQAQSTQSQAQSTQSQAQSTQPPPKRQAQSTQLPLQQQQTQLLSPQLARPSSPPAKEDPHKATDISPCHHAFSQGAPSSPAAGDCNPSSVCVESRASHPQKQPSQNGNEDSEQGGGWGSRCREGGGGETRVFLSADVFEAELLRARQKPLFPLANTQLHVTEEFIDDDPTEMSFYGGGAEAYYGYEEKWGSSMDSPQLSPFNSKSSPLCLSPSFQMSTLSLPGAGQAPSPLQSPILSERYPTDKAYFIAKEILTTERTYLKDLEVITVWFRSAVIKENAMPEGLMTLLFSNIDPIYEFHRGFLKEIDQRLALWEGRSNAHVKGDYQRIGDVMLRNMCALKEFTNYLQKHDEVLTELEKATKRLKKLETVYKEFELQKVCYLPLNTFLLKPIQRLMHYKLILERLCKHYSPDHPDHNNCREALKEVAEMTNQLQSSLIRLENFQKLSELQRDLIGIENLTAPGREFIREGCLYKLTKKGLQQRMFFLFSDQLLYTSKGVTATNQFKVHGQLPLHGMIVEESENEWSVPHCFTIYSAQRTIVVAASSKVEMGKWIEDLNMAIEMTKKSQEKSDLFLDPGLCDRSNRSSDEVSLDQESEDDMSSSRNSLDKQTHHRANSTMHVCWHRNTSVSMSDHSLAVENQLSGYLLRKFKNSNGWQKLWVVFTNFCLFFYKTHQDDFPLASLPLLGYTVSSPGESDSIHKEYVFKLHFKSHVYFFRAESEYTFERWMEVIKSAASATGRMSLLIPKGPLQMNGN
ncbi:FERM, ARHGEF and pleckstrin domain-containing protein 2 isoform X3 [Oncorhynchus kisutch]|uniref:FERM, ARHGEF and pleckstrin domain-containing protein 2 isoform X3 n=1 Tax=Oncorhynchus kisutch TaxID=8019 RepID=UPI0012DDB455|nr:FERM, ARHGEF and pleckstrin domain-containing protein 2 isoform X3 [Oncorhynchus kisutch]